MASSPMPPTGVPCTVRPRVWAQSSMRGIPWLFKVRTSAGSPNMCGTITALVRRVRTGVTACGERWYVAGSMSTNTGFAPVRRTACQSAVQT